MKRKATCRSKIWKIWQATGGGDVFLVDEETHSCVEIFSELRARVGKEGRGPWTGVEKEHGFWCNTCCPSALTLPVSATGLSEDIPQPPARASAPSLR